MNPEVEVKPTKMTKFHCQELLYEYVSGTLSERRRADLERFLPTCRESQTELERLKRGLAYGEVARRVALSEPLREALRDFEPPWQKKLREWTRWSSQRGWRLLPYVFAVATVAAGIVAFQPWKNFGQRDMVLAEEKRVEMDDHGLDLNSRPVVPGEAITAPTAAKAAAPVAAPAGPAPAPALPPAAPAPVAAVVTAPPAAKPAAAPPSSPALVMAHEEETGGTRSEAERIAEQKQEKPAAPRGFVTRGQMVVSGFNDAWPAIKDKIAALGGKAAGNVELGWLRGPKESYFHFSLPESNLSELELFLGTFSPVRFETEKHPRVMPEGQIRIILVVKDGGPEQPSSDVDENESAPETP